MRADIVRFFGPIDAAAVQDRNQRKTLTKVQGQLARLAQQTARPTD
jgi:hypothetical protein